MNGSTCVYLLCSPGGREKGSERSGPPSVVNYSLREYQNNCMDTGERKGRGPRKLPTPSPPQKQNTPVYQSPPNTHTTHTHTRTRTRTHTHTHTLAHTRAYTRTYTHTHTHIHTRTHTHTRARAHTHTQIQFVCLFYVG